jgi:aspartate carbamoyltransferase catalytic subunit
MSDVGTLLQTARVLEFVGIDACVLRSEPQRSAASLELAMELATELMLALMLVAPCCAEF